MWSKEWERAEIFNELYSLHSGFLGIYVNENVEQHQVYLKFDDNSIKYTSDYDLEL